MTKVTQDVVLLIENQDFPCFPVFFSPIVVLEKYSKGSNKRAEINGHFTFSNPGSARPY